MDSNDVEAEETVNLSEVSGEDGNEPSSASALIESANEPSKANATIESTSSGAQLPVPARNPQKSKTIRHILKISLFLENSLKHHATVNKLLAAGIARFKESRPDAIVVIVEHDSLIERMYNETTTKPQKDKANDFKFDLHRPTAQEAQKASAEIYFDDVHLSGKAQERLGRYAADLISKYFLDIN